MARPCSECKNRELKPYNHNCRECAFAPYDEWPGFEAKEEKGCHNCGRRHSPSQVMYHCGKCGSLVRDDGTKTVPSHWISEKEDQECVDTDSVKPLGNSTIKRLMNSVYGGRDLKPAHEDKLDAMRYISTHNPYLKEIGKCAAGVKKFDELYEYCMADIKATLEAYNNLKEETMPTKNNTTGPNFYVRYSDIFKVPKTTLPGIKKVIFSNPCTIVLWDDGTKTMVRAQGKERFDREKGLAMAIAKKALGNKGNYYDTFTEHLSKPVAKKKGKGKK